MSNNFQPNPDKRSDQAGPNPLDKIHKLPGMDREKHDKIVAATLKGMGIKDERASDTDRLIQEAIRRMKNVRDWGRCEVQEAIDKGRDTASGTFQAHVSGGVWRKLAENYGHYDKDQLLVILCSYAANAIMKEVL